MIVTIDTDTIREVARRTTNVEVRDAFRMLAALLDRHYLKREDDEEAFHASIMDDITDHYGSGE